MAEETKEKQVNFPFPKNGSGIKGDDKLEMISSCCDLGYKCKYRYNIARYYNTIT